MAQQFREPLHQKQAAFQMKVNTPTMRQNSTHMMQQRINVQQAKQEVKDNPHSLSHSVQQFTKQNIDITRDTEKLSQDQQRISNLHSMLHKEAEKIRQWKTETELELKQKDRSLTDAMTTIESLRKSILDLQFQNEDYSTRLHESSIEKEETQHKIEATCEMANVLREQMIQLEKRIMQAEHDKEELAGENKKRLNESQSLVLKFQELDISQATLAESHRQAVVKISNESKEKFSEMQAKARQLESQLITLINLKQKHEEEIALYQAKAKENETTIHHLKGSLQEAGASIQHLQMKFKDTCTQLEQSEKLLMDKTNELTNATHKLDEAAKELKETSDLCAEANSRLQAAVQESAGAKKHQMQVEDIYSKEISALQNDVKNLEDQLDKKRGEYLNVSTELEKMAEDLERVNKAANIKDENIAELKARVSELAQTSEGLEVKCKILTANLEATKHSLKIQQADYYDLNHKKEALIEEVHQMKEQMSEQEESKRNLETQLGLATSTLQAFEEASRENAAKTKQYACQLDQIRQELDESRVKSETLEARLTEREHLCHKLLEDKKALEDNLSSVQHEFYTHEIQLHKAVEELQILEQHKEELRGKAVKAQQDHDKAIEQMQQLAKLLENKEVELLSLTGAEQAKASNFQNELETREKEVEDLDNKTKVMQQQISTKNKQIKALERDLRTIKMQLKKKTEKELQYEDNLVLMQRSFDNLQEQLVKATSTSEQQKSEVERIQHEMKIAKDSFEVQQQEFCNTIQRYKDENDRIVEQYVSENKILKTGMETIKMEAEKEANKLRVELNDAHQIIEDMKRRMGSLTKDVQERSQENKLLEDILHNMKRDRRGENIHMEMAQKHTESQSQPPSPLANEEYQDCLVPTTPKLAACYNAITPQSHTIQRKRVLFTGVEKENTFPMDVDGAEQLSTTQKTHMHQRSKHSLNPIKPNIRFSPKPSPSILQELEDEATHEDHGTAKLNRVGRGNKMHPSNIDHYSSTQHLRDVTIRQSKASAMPSPKIQKRADNMLRKQSPADAKQCKGSTHKMKKVSIKESKNTAWFDIDNVFGFDG